MDGRVGSLGTVKLLALTFVVGTILGLAGMALWAAVDDGGDDDATATQAGGLSIAEQLHSEGADEPAESPPTTAADTRAGRCTDAARTLEAPLAAARPALRQWDVHVSAMNQLVVGEITLQQASAFWNRTRVGAQRNVERFRTAWADVERAGVDCPAPGLMGRAPAAVRSCARLVDAELGVLQVARTSIGTWDKHVHHMDMLRLGTLSPEDATQMWLSMWQRGVQELKAYRTAARAPGLEAECPEAGPAN
jgi:hypothetical protein